MKPWSTLNGLKSGRTNRTTSGEGSGEFKELKPKVGDGLIRRHFKVAWSRPWTQPPEWLQAVGLCRWAFVIFPLVTSLAWSPWAVPFSCSNNPWSFGSGCAQWRKRFRLGLSFGCISNVRLGSRRKSVEVVVLLLPDLKTAIWVPVHNYSGT